MTPSVMARCARGEHDPETKYGVVGIILAIVCFPCGLICLWSVQDIASSSRKETYADLSSANKKKRCIRCGVIVE